MVSSCIICGVEFAEVTCKKTCSLVCVKEKNRCWLKAYRQTHPQLSSIIAKRWQKKNPEKWKEIHRSYEQVRRAVRRAVGSFTKKQWQDLIVENHLKNSL